MKRLTRELQDAKVKVAMGGGEPARTAGGDDRTALNGAVADVRRPADGLDRAALRTLADSIKSTLESGVIFLASEADGKVALVVSVTKDLTGKFRRASSSARSPRSSAAAAAAAPISPRPAVKIPKIDDLLKESRVVVEQLETAGG